MRSFIAPLVLAALGVHAAVTPTPTRRWVDNKFASAKNGQFSVNGSEFKFVGTNAYWLPWLNSEADIDNVLAKMAADGITVVRTWAFNDVTSIPAEGGWLQLIANGTTQINTGANGLQRLDTVVELAAKHGIYVLFSLTNNWNPTSNLTSTPSSGSGSGSGSSPSPSPLPRNSLSNDYGGMDAYVREFGSQGQHSEFYTDSNIRTIFQDFASVIVKRFANNTNVFSWELANDPRCNSTLVTADDCTTNTVTRWHSEVSDFVRSIDPNHLVSSGDAGFACATCPKLFPLTPPPAPSQSPNGKRKRSPVPALTKSRQARKVADARKARRAADPAPGDGVRIRGRWVANKEAKRQTSSSVLGTSFDGSTGVDSQDILNIPNIGFGSFQYFPDQNTYNLPGQPAQPTNFTDLVQQGIEWIQFSAQQAQAVGKPLALTGFGLVTQENFPFFVPFDATTPPPSGVTNTTDPETVGDSGVPSVVGLAVPGKVMDTTSTGQQPAANSVPSTALSGTNGVTQTQQTSAYQSWFNAALNSGVSGVLTYQFGAGSLTSAAGTVVQGTTTGAGTVTQGAAPNDGYGGVSQQSSLDGTISQAATNAANSVGTSS